MTREFPPYIYGGAGVHVTELSKVLVKHAQVHVHAFDGSRADLTDLPVGVQVHGYEENPLLADANAALRTLSVDLAMVQGANGADLVHSHTWYANMAGHLAAKLYGVPHVISAHSLEPLRPWKREQLGGGYEVSSWCEKTAYEAADGIIAVSRAMREDILRCYPQVDPQKVTVIHNGIDLSGWQRAADITQARTRAKQFGIDPDAPTIIFVGRITRQKGVPGLLRAMALLPKEVQLVLCAGAPDTPQIAKEVKDLVDKIRQDRDNVIWIEQHLPRVELIDLLSVATTFVTPSIYEPLGIVNLEAMAVGLPVVGTHTGGIPDCIVHGETGLLVPIEQKNDGTGTALNPDKFEADLAQALATVVSDPQKAHAMGLAGRKRVEECFSWNSIALKTMEFYTEVLSR